MAFQRVEHSMQRRSVAASLVSAALIATSNGAAAAAATKAVQCAGAVVFNGTITAARASNVDGITGDERTAIVHVNSVSKAAEPAMLRGQDVTIRLRNASSAQEGREARFCVNSWIWADHIALVEVGPTVFVGASTVKVSAEDRAVRDHIRAKSRAAGVTVVVGRVTSTRPARTVVDPFPPANSEHDPILTEAVVNVSQRLTKRGSTATPTATVVFPASHDIAWARAPKLHVGQQSVFVLTLVPRHGLAGANGPPVYTVLDPSDVLTLERLSTVKAAVAPNPPR
jgi:hypothetical protein